MIDRQAGNHLEMMLDQGSFYKVGTFLVVINQCNFEFWHIKLNTIKQSQKNFYRNESKLNAKISKMIFFL